MVANPLHVRVFGTDKARCEVRLQRFFGVMLDHIWRHGQLLGAWTQPGAVQLVGVLGLIRPGHCCPAPLARLWLGARMLAGQSPATGRRIGRWLVVWERQDPDTPHWHVGPLAVHPEHRRQGIATQLMHAGCRLIDATEPAPAWLETDLERNTRLYHRFGFSTAHEETVLGTRNWFMIRPAANPAQQRGFPVAPPRPGADKRRRS